MASRPTTKRRKRKQNQRRKYGRLRDQLQARGEVPVIPEGAVRSEVVDPSSQEEVTLPKLIEAAIRQGWAVPDAKKPRLVDELTTIAELPEYENPKVLLAKVQAVNALHRGDQMEWERRNPELAAKTKGGVKVDVANNVAVAVIDPYEAYKRALAESLDDQVEARIEQEAKSGEVRSDP